MNNFHKKILYLGPIETLSLVKTRLSKFDVINISNKYDLSKNIESCDVILDASMKIKFDKDLLKKAKNIKLFVTATTGSSHINSDYLNSINVPLLTLKGEINLLNNITPASELSWLLLMMCARNAYKAVKHVKEGFWDRNQFPGIMLNKKTIGIIGIGRLGKWVASYAKGFGLNCLGYDPYVEIMPENVKKSSLNNLLKNSDFISLHVNYDPNKGKLLTAEHISKMKKGAIFINTSRGELVDEGALIKSLKAGFLAGIGVDVLTGEPDIEKNKIYQLRNSDLNIVITPHIGGFSYDALNQVLEFCCNRIINNLNINK